jgi:hypothetical protein
MTPRSAFERPPASIRDLYTDNIDGSNALSRVFGAHRRKAVTNETCDYLICNSVGKQDRFREAARCIIEDAERTAPFRTKSRFSKRHRLEFPIGLDRYGLI